MADAREALRLKAEALARRGVVLSELERNALRRSLAEGLEERRDRASSPLSAAAQQLRSQVARLKLTTRAAARRLGMSRDRLRAILQGRGEPPADMTGRLEVSEA